MFVCFACGEEVHRLTVRRIRGVTFCDFNCYARSITSGGEEQVPRNRPCRCGSGEPSYWINDARGIPLTRVCDQCRAERTEGFRPDVINDPNYWTDEPVDPEE